MGTHRIKAFKFEMVGLSVGDKIVFDPLGIEVPISGPKTVRYDGKDWALSSFCKEYLPHKSASNSYRGPMFFSYNGKTLFEIRNELDKMREDEEDW